MLVITDKPLERYVGSGYSTSVPGSIVAPNVYSSSGCNIPLKFGAMELFACQDSTDDNLHSLLPADNSWYRYQSSNYPDYDYAEILTCPYNDRKFMFDTADLFFVYWYLANVGDNIAYVYGKNISQFSEMPVVRIDIADKGSGMRPMNSCRREDILYIFSDRENVAHSHDTALLEMMSIHAPCRFPNWRLLPDGISLNGLIGMCGDCVSDIFVFDQNDVSKAGKDIFRYFSWT